MGSLTKGSERERLSLTNAIKLSKSLISNVVRKTIERFLVFFAMTALPHLAPQIYMAYKLYNHAKTAIRAYEEYIDLSKTMTKKEAAIIEAKRVVARESVKQAVSEETISKVSAQVADLLTLSEFEKLTNDDEQVKYMLHATLCQFMIGAIVGSRDTLIQQASELIR